MILQTKFKVSKWLSKFFTIVQSHWETAFLLLLYISITVWDESKLVKISTSQGLETIRASPGLLNSNLWQLLSPVISFLWVIRLELTTSARSISGEIVRRVWIYGQVIYKLWWCWDEEEREIYKHLDVKQWQISWPTTPVFYLSTFLLAVVLYHHSDITVTRF